MTNDRQGASSSSSIVQTLPLELLPQILQQLRWRTKDLANCALVNKTWYRFANPLLYSRLFLRDQIRLIKVFKTLKTNTKNLANLIKVLEIRVFPFGLKAEDLEEVEENIVFTLQHAINLEELFWTRTGSLTDRVIPFLPPLPKLQTLELTGSSRFYTPSLITKHLLDKKKTPSLKHFSILLPDRDVAIELPQWCKAMGSKLKSFSVLCQHSALINDETLTLISPHLTGLERLSIAGCKTVTAQGILALLTSSTNGIQDLAIEGLALHPSSFIKLAEHLTQLHSISLTFPRQNLCPTNEFWSNLANFVEDLPKLQNFTHYTSSWNTPKGMYSDTLDSDEDSMGDDGDNGENGVTQNGNGNGHEIRRRYTGSTPQEYRRHELEDHAQTGRPIVREPKLSTTFLKRLLNARGNQLIKLRIHGIVMTMEQVCEISKSCSSLQDLVVHLYEGEKDLLQEALIGLKNLHSLHILSSLYSDVYLSEDNLRQIAANCSTELRQIGFRNRIWLIDRISDVQLENEMQTIGSQQQQQNPTNVHNSISLRETAMAAGPFVRSMSTAPNTSL